MLAEDHDKGASTFMSPDVPVLVVPLDMVADVVVLVPVAPEADVVIVTLSPPFNAESIVLLLDESIVKSVGSKSQF